MAIHLYIAPAASGKTAYAINEARQAAGDLQAEVRVCVATRLQVRAWRQGVAKAGGAIGVRVYTFRSLAAACLSEAGEAYSQLSEPVLHRLLRSIVQQLPLNHYAPLKEKPGFVQVLASLMVELKSAQANPLAFRKGIEAHLNEPRLVELAQIYEAYQTALQTNRWADRVGLTWLAVESLARRKRDPSPAWPLLIFDGFDSFTPAQLSLLQALAGQAERTIITLSGPEDVDRPSRYSRYRQTRQDLESALNIEAKRLPVTGRDQSAVLRHLAANLFLTPATEKPAGDPALVLMAAPDQAAEARSALRWLKEQLLAKRLTPGEAALLARDSAPYRPHVIQIAAEFGLPIYLVDGRALSGNPLISALMDLLRMALPGGESGKPALPRRLVVEAWRSPYFDWSNLRAHDGPAVDIRHGDADLLDSVARFGRVVGGLEQWQGALQALGGHDQLSDRRRDELIRAHLPVGEEARRLQNRFEAFGQFIQPPPHLSTMRAFVGWLEALIGPDPDIQVSSDALMGLKGSSLNMVARAKGAAPEGAALDVAALRALKEVLRGLAWSDEVVGRRGEDRRVDFARFYRELKGAIELAQLRQPGRSDENGILFGDIREARGLPFRAVAVMGLAEGSLPAVIGEDPFLRDADRASLRRHSELFLEPSTRSDEQQFFYEAVSRGADALLLTRPRLAESGAEWVASPFWREVCRQLDVTPLTIGGGRSVFPHEAASWPELMESLALFPEERAVRRWASGERAEKVESLQMVSRLFQQRQGNQATVYDGDLRRMSEEFGKRFGPGYTWSASRLEQYRTCGYWFFVSSVLSLEPRHEPVEGIDVRQLGNIYHHIFEAVYRDPKQVPAAGSGQVRQFVAATAASILDEAPAKEGFRETAWWAQTREEIVERVTQSVINLAEMDPDFSPLRNEAAFFGGNALLVEEDGDAFRLHGFIDRVDRDELGRIRIIDYKLGGAGGFNKRALMDGKRLQLPLYALAAQEALGLGEVVDGFYWHYWTAEPSSLKLANYDGGIQGAMDTAVAYAWTAVHGARGGEFVPKRPDGGCPSYCAAAAFCWHYSPGFGG